MAREFAPVPIKIWGEDAFRALSPGAQHLYFVLSTSPALSHAGVTDWRPRRVAALAAGWSVDDVVTAAAELIDALRIVVDEDTEEVLLVDHVRHDGILKQPRMATAMATAHAAIASAALRAVVVHELQRAHAEDPEAKGWGSAAAAELLARTAVDPAGSRLRNGSGDGLLEPSQNGSVEGSGKGSVKGSPEGSGEGSVDPNGTSSVEGSGKGSPTPVPAPAPKDLSSTSRRSPRGERLPEGWQPARELIEQMRGECPGLDLQAEHLKFRDFWVAKTGKDATKADWPATWRNWMRTARDRQRNGTATSMPGQGQASARDRALNPHLFGGRP